LARARFSALVSGCGVPPFGPAAPDLAEAAPVLGWLARIFVAFGRPGPSAWPSRSSPLGSRSVT
jgi:hypothetical protein